MLTNIKKVVLAAALSMISTMAFADEIHFMTYNIASLPSLFGTQINGKFLRPNAERVDEIVKIINQWNQDHDSNTPQVIAFEEAFDPAVRCQLKQKLSVNYPYNSGEYGQKILNAGSGLLLFSQYPVLEMSFHPYKNMMVGEETLANKGFITAKLKYQHYFITVIITHLEAGGAIFKDQQSKQATTSVRRGQQMGEIAQEIFDTAHKPPKGNENLTYLKTFVMGDFNVTLSSERQQKSISTGLSDNGFHEGQIKYPGQYQLFTLLMNTVPDNFIEVRTLPTQKGEGKQVNHELLKQAIQQNLFTGSTFVETQLIQDKKNMKYPNRQETELKIIDGIFATHEGISGEFRTHLISLNEDTHYSYAISDHITLLGKFVF